MKNSDRLAMIVTVGSVALLLLVYSLTACAQGEIEYGTVGKHTALIFHTKHFDIELVKEYASYKSLISKYLDQGYDIYWKYTGYSIDDVTRRMGDRPRYLFMFLLPEDMWRPGWKGGLTSGNVSQVAATLLPGLNLEEIEKGNPALSVIWHELANGWSSIYTHYSDGRPNYAPWWFASEGHAGFLRQHAMVDSGWPVEQVREYKVALREVDKYLNGESYDQGHVCHVLLQSLWAEYGWDFFRATYHAIQEGKLTFPYPFDKNSVIRSYSILVRFLSESARGNLIPFFEKFKIKVDQETQEALAKLPIADIPVERSVLVKEPRHPLRIKF